MGNVGTIGATCDTSTTLNCSLSPACAAGLLYDTATLATVLAVMPIILAFGLIGNLAFLFVMSRVPSMRTVTNVYLANLAVADALFLVVSVGDKLAQYFVTPFPGDQFHLGIAGCTALYFLQHLFNWVSIFLVTLVTLEKYYGVCHPLRHMVLHTFSRTWKLIAAAWLLALALSAAMVPAHYRVLNYCILWPDGDQYSDLPDRMGYCAGILGHDWLGTSSNFSQTVPFFCAMVFNCFAYTRIVCALRLRPGVAVLPQEAILQNNRVRNQVSVMLITNGLAFFVCVAPFQLFSVAVAINELDGGTINFGGFFVHVARTMLYLNSAVNPYIYNVTNSCYRRSFRNAFTCRASSRGPRCPSGRRRVYLENASLRRTLSPQWYHQNGDGLPMLRLDKNSSNQ